MDGIYKHIPEEVLRTSAEVSSLIVRARDLGEQAVSHLLNPSDIVDLDIKVFGGFICRSAESESMTETSLTD